MRKGIHIVFVCLCLAFLATGLGRTLFLPKDVNQYENRYANQVPAFTVSAFLDGSFQSGADAALMDQIPAAQYMKKFYNLCSSRYGRGVLDALSAPLGLDGTRYVRFGALRLFGEDYITSWPRSIPSVLPELDARIDNLNAAFARHPDMDFTVFYIEKDSDVDFETMKQSGINEYLLNSLLIPAEKKGVYSVDDFDTFSRYFYKTDSHWNADGSYAAYRQLFALLGCEGTPLSPAGEAVKVSDTFSGKKAATIGADGVFTETFRAYPYDFPPMTVTINGAPAEDYGQQEAYLSGTTAEPVSYGMFYGRDNGETILSTGTEGRGRILVVGDSFDNALLKLLACHYDALYSVDLRYYEYSMGKPFALSDYVTEHGIDKVLLIGNLDYFVSDTFDLED